ncbi:MAG: hypothetical protein AB1695_08295 [Stygiobacter sp.]
MSSDSSKKLSLDVKKLTALWAFSESTLGGILHALRIPFTGLFVGSASVFFISLIAQNSKSKTQILRSTFLVILVKVVVTPFVQLTSHFAVLLQGLIGYFLFRFFPFRKVSTFLFAITVLLLSAFQKIIILTILFGNGLWIAIDSFMKFLVLQFSLPKEYENISISWILITIYASLHLLAGIFISIKILGFKKWYEEKKKQIDLNYITFKDDKDYFQKKNGKKKKRWWQKKSGISILVFSFAVMIISYLYPNLGKNIAYEILFMLIRSFIITFIWFEFISPKLISYLQKFFEKEKFQHASEINSLTSVFPDFKKVINYVWENSKSLNGLKRIRFFLSNTISLMFLINEQE